MENASKAFIIAGGMLIAMLIVGLLVWGYTNISSYRKSQIESEEMEQVLEFNKKFEAYNKATVRGYQMISLSNLANDVNKRFEEEEYKKVEIHAIMSEDALLPGATSSERVPSTNYYDMVKYVNNIYSSGILNSNQKNEFKQLYFECTNVEYDRNNNRVIKMEYKQVKVKAST